MSHGGWAALPRGTTWLSAVCDCGISGHTHLLFMKQNINKPLNVLLLLSWCIVLEHGLFDLIGTYKFFGQQFIE